MTDYFSHALKTSKNQSSSACHSFLCSWEPSRILSKLQCLMLIHARNINSLKGS